MLIYLLIFCIIGLFDADAGQRKGQETEYKLRLLKEISDCEDFTNDHFKMSELKLIREGDSSWLQGIIYAFKDIEEETIISITVHKRDDITGEFSLYYNIEGSFCDFTEDSKPWTVLLQVMEVKSCPIQANNFTVDHFNLNVEYAKDYMRHEFIGVYFVIMKLLSPGKGLDVASNTISCHLIDADLL